MKEQFQTPAFRKDRLNTIAKANEIITSYLTQGYRLTLRQLYYQFVSRDLIPNTERSYKNLGECINQGRLCGMIDWAAIEDRVRVPRLPSEWDNVEDLVSSAVYSYRLPRLAGQENYVELWVEKDALAGVLSPLASEFHVGLMVNRGYSSQSAMYEASKRFLRKQQLHDRCHLIYLGDHDPSGEDMVRDIQDRLDMFGARVQVTKLALTMEQVEEHEPPPNPAKMTDARAGAYVAKHGDSSWEVDALPPNVLAKLIRESLESLIDSDKVAVIKEREERDREALKKAAAKINNHR